MDKKLKKTHKGFRIEEAARIYQQRHGIDMSFEDFVDKIWMTEEFSSNEEFDRIIEDIHMRNSIYFPRTNNELTEEEWSLLINEFGE
jgi:hypothetical protein